jgi:hypothetical protein
VDEGKDEQSMGYAAQERADDGNGFISLIAQEDEECSRPAILRPNCHCPSLPSDVDDAICQVIQVGYFTWPSPPHQVFGAWSPPNFHLLTNGVLLSFNWHPGARALSYLHSGPGGGLNYALNCNLPHASDVARGARELTNVVLNCCLIGVFYLK